MKILVTGSNGFIAQHIIAELLNDKNNFVIATAKGASRLNFDDPEHYIFQSLDITNRETIDEVFAAHEPDVVIHVAAYGQPDFCELNKVECDKVNVEGTKNIADACKANDVYLLFISTDFVFSGEHGPYKEEDACNPVNYYGLSKLKCENYILQSGADYGIARLCSVYGFPLSGTTKNVVTFVKDNLEKNIAVKIVTDQKRTPTFVKDVAKGVAAMARLKVPGIFHIAGEETFSPYEYALKTAEYLKLNTGLIEKADVSNFTQPASRPLITGFIIDKAKRELNFKPISFDQALQKMFGNK